MLQPLIQTFVYSGQRAQFGYAQKPAQPFGEHIFEPDEDSLLILPRGPVALDPSGSEAGHQCVDDPLLQASRDLGVPQDLRSGLSEPAGLRKEAQQPGGVAGGRPQDPTGCGRGQHLPGYSLAVPFELSRRQPEQAPATGSGRSLVEPLGAAVEHDLPGVQFHAAPDNRWAQTRRKSHKDERRRQRNIGDPRKILLAAQQIEVIQPRARHAGLEFASRRNKQEAEGYSVQARLVIIGVDKGARPAPWHSFSLQVSWRKAADPGLGAGKRY